MRGREWEGGNGRDLNKSPQFRVLGWVVWRNATQRTRDVIVASYPEKSKGPYG